VSKQLAQGCYPVEKWQSRDANPGPLSHYATQQQQQQQQQLLLLLLLLLLVLVAFIFCVNLWLWLYAGTGLQFDGSQIIIARRRRRRRSCVNKEVYFEWWRIRCVALRWRGLDLIMLAHNLPWPSDRLKPMTHERRHLQLRLKMFCCCLTSLTKSGVVIGQRLVYKKLPT